MKIKEKESRTGVAKRIISSYGKKRTLLIGVYSVGVLLVAGAAFFGTLGYGAYLKKVGETTYYKHALLQMADFDFSFLKNLAKGRFSEFDKINLDIKFKHILRLQYLREQALEQGIISDAIKKEEFPATLFYNGQKHDVKISLAGMMTMHVADPLKWSFQVKVKGDDTIRGMKRFGLLLPHTRGYLTDWIGMELMKERDLIGLRVDFVDVDINGKSQGIFYLEERFDKYLLESNRLRDGIIFRLENELIAYREQKLLENPESKAQLLMLKRMWQDVMSGDLPPHKFFDLSKMAKMFAITDLMNNKHALYRTNLRFYFNPITGLVEPIAREWGSLTKNKIENLSLFLEESELGSRHSLLKNDPVLKIIYDNLDFKRHYFQEAEILSDPKLLNHVMRKNGSKLNSLVKKVYRDWPFYDLPTQSMYLNQQYFKSVLFSDINLISGYFIDKEAGKFSLYLKNLQDLPIEVFGVSWRDSVIYQSPQSILISPKQEEDGNVYNFDIPSEHPLVDSMIPELEVHYNILGMQTGMKSVLVYPWSYEERFERSTNPVMKEANYASFKFITEDLNNKEVAIPEGEWTLDRDLIVPMNRRFVVDEGAKIDLIDGARIISYSPIYCRGSKSNPVNVISSDSTGQGIFIVRANERSNLAHANFELLSRPIEDGWNLSGAVTFYESPVDISFCTFSDNQNGDDFLNIIRSDFTMEESHFRKILADALDCDFCTGKISNSSFVAVGNDGIDVSGTQLVISHVYMDQIGDKGLSAGEDSQMKANFVEIGNAEIGVTSKDRSVVEISNLNLANCKVGITLFQKKSEFGPAFASLERLKIEKSEIPFLVEQSSSLKLDGEAYISDRMNVKDILYGIEYGKSSK